MTHSWAVPGGYNLLSCHLARQNMHLSDSTLAIPIMNRLLFAYIKANDLHGLCVLAIGTSRLRVK